MMFTTLFRRLSGFVGRPVEGTLRRPASRGRRTGQPRRFVPQLTVLEDRTVPSALHHGLLPHDHHLLPHLGPAQMAEPEDQLPFREHLTLVNVSPTGVLTFQGWATYFGRVTAAVSPDNTFIKLAASGDTASGFVTHATALTGTITFTSGTGPFQGISGTESYVFSTDSETGATTVDVKGTVSLPNWGGDENQDTHVVPFQINGGGPAPQGLPLFIGGTAIHSATGTGTLLGNYTGDGLFTLDSFTSPTTGTFHGAFTFVAANGDRLATTYGAVTPGHFTVIPASDGKVVVQFVAVFTPVPEESTGRFADITGGGWIMVATSEPFDPTPSAQGYTMPFHYSWQGFGFLQFGHGDQ
jgi:hypothetical protein